MEAFELLGTIGEGTYGVVLKARHKETGQIVAIKKFKESDEDEQVRKTALREVRILKQLRHDNIVSLIEVFRRKKKLYLVFEYVESTLLEELERHPDGLDPMQVKQIMWQLVLGVDHLHSHNVIHRDLKPENLLLSKNGLLKLCDFGFARTLAGPGARYTDYVSTRWYRCPELLIGDTSYGKAVDMWALGCLMAEISNGLPLFPGDSDVDQLFQIMKVGGPLSARAMDLLKRNPLFNGVRVPDVPHPEPLEKRLPTLDPLAVDVIKQCLRYEPLQRISASELLRHPYFAGIEDSYGLAYRIAVEKDAQANILVRRAAQAAGAAAPAPAPKPSPAPAPAPAPAATTPAKSQQVPGQGLSQASLYGGSPAPATTGAAQAAAPRAGHPTQAGAASDAAASHGAAASGVGAKAAPVASPVGQAIQSVAHAVAGAAVAAKKDSRAGDQGDDRVSELDTRGDRGTDVPDDASSHADGMSQLSSRIAAQMAAGNMRRDRPMNSGKANGNNATGGQPGFGANAGPLGSIPGLSQALHRAGAGAWPADVQRSMDVMAGDTPKHPSISPLGSRSNSPGGTRHFDADSSFGSSVGALSQSGGMAAHNARVVASQYSSTYPGPSSQAVSNVMRERKEKESDEAGPSAGSGPAQSPVAASGSTGFMSSSSGYGNGYSMGGGGAGTGQAPGRRAPMDPFARQPAGQTGTGSLPVRRFGSEGKEDEDEAGPSQAGADRHTVRITMGDQTWTNGAPSQARANGQAGASTVARGASLGPGLHQSSIEDTLASMGLGQSGQGVKGQAQALDAARAGMGTRGRERGRDGRESKERDNSRDRSPAASQLGAGPSSRVGGSNGNVLGPSTSSLSNSYSSIDYSAGKDPLHGGPSMMTGHGGYIQAQAIGIGVGMNVGNMQMPFVIGTGGPGAVDEDRENRMYGSSGLPGGGLYTEDSLYASLRSDMASRARDREAAQGRERERQERRRQELAQTQPPGQAYDRRGLPSREGRDRSTLQSRGASVVGIGQTGPSAYTNPSPARGYGTEPSISITGMAATPGPSTSHGKQQAVYIPPGAAQAANGRYGATAAGQSHGILGSGGVGLSGLSVTAIRRDAGGVRGPNDRPVVASSHGIPTGLQGPSLSLGSIVLGQSRGVGAGGSYAMSYGTSYRAMRDREHATPGVLRSSMGLPVGLQASNSTSSMPYRAPMPGMPTSMGMGVGGMSRPVAAPMPSVGGLSGISGYGLHGAGLSLRGQGAR